MNWKQELKLNIRKLDKLRKYYQPLGVNSEEIAEIESAAQLSGINIPERYLQDLIKGASSEKDLKQIKRLILPGFNPSIKNINLEGITFVEPTDQDRNPLRGLTQFYPDRVLISITPQCIVNCQWCFRMKEDEVYLTQNDFDAIFEYIRKHKNISDVILTGGEPLFISDKKLSVILENLRAIEHVDIVLTPIHRTTQQYTFV